MRGLHTAGALLAPALVGAISLEDSIPRAFITVHLPEPADSTPSPDLVFRFDINESQDACGYGNVTINGQRLSENGHGPLTLDGDRVVDAAWNFTCVIWNDKPQEQLLSLNVEHVNGRAVEDVGFTLRFQQVAPVWISDVEGSASMTRVHSNHQGQSEPDCDDDKEIDLDAELAELDYLRWQMAELAHLLHAKEHRLAEAFGWERHHGPARIHECDSLRCVIEAIAHTVKGAASSIYGGGRHGPHGPGPHPHRPGDEHRGGPHHRFGKPGHGNHTENGTDPSPPPPGRKPHFPHPPPFCKCAPPPPPPHHGDYPPPPPPHHGDHPPPPPPPPPPPHGAYPPPPPPPPGPHGGFPPPPPPPGPHGDFPPPPPGPGFGPRPPPPPHGGPGFWESLFGFVHPHGPPPPMPWERPDWEHPAPDGHSHHGHGHGHEGGPPRMGHEGHHGPSDEGDEREHDHHEGPQHFNEPERKPEHLDHGDHKPSNEFKGPEAKTEEQENDRKPEDLPVAHSKKPEDSKPARPDEHHHADMPWEAELRRAHDHGAPPHDGPHDHKEFPGHHPPPSGPPPPGPPPPGPPPPPGHHSHGPPPPPHHGPIFIHIASAISSLVLVVVFGSVLYQRYVRKSIRSPRVRRNSNAPWYKRLCFGPNYSELSEDEEKEAMLRNCGDSDYDDEDDSEVVARDISQFRTAADVVGEMVAVEEARMVEHSRQQSFSPAPAPAPIPTQQQHMQQHMHPYIPNHLMPTSSIPMPMPTGPLSPDPATMAAMAAMFPDLVHDLDMDLGHHHGGAGEVPGEELPAYQEADRQSDSDASEFASSMVTDGYRPGCSGSSYTPSESGSQGAGDILGDTKN